MQKLRRQRRDVPLPERGPAPGADRSGDAEAARAPGMVQVHGGGIMGEEMDLAEMTVGEAHRLLRGPYRIPPNAHALVNGTEADADRRLAEGDTLEFVRLAGEKGATE